MTNSTTYALPGNNRVLDHAASLTALPSWLGDYAADADDNKAHQRRKKATRRLADTREFNADDALAASGDYFITLATSLDKIAQSLPRDSSQQIEIENLVNTLFYLQKHYVVIAKHKLQS